MSSTHETDARRPRHLVRAAAIAAGVAIAAGAVATLTAFGNDTTPKSAPAPAHGRIEHA